VLTDKTHGKHLAHGKFFETVTGRQFCLVPWAGTRQIQNFAVGFFFAKCQSLSTRQSIGEKIKLSLPKFSKIHIFYMGLDINIWYFLKSIRYI